MTDARVLLVDDEAAVCLVLTEALRDGGFQVVDAMTDDEAADALAGEPIDLLVTDINVAVRGWGFDFARQAREAYPELPVLYITGDSEAAFSTQGVPGSRLLPKPFAPAELVAACHEMLAEASQNSA